MGSVRSWLRRLAAATVAVTLVAAAIGGCSSSTNPPPTTGSARVTIQPAGATAATWTLDGGAARASGATVSGLSPGNHTVHFNALAGFTAPADQQVTVAAGQTTNAVGTYTAIVPTTGSVLVTIQPAGAAAATWTVDGGAAQANGATVTNLAPGAHTVHFNALAGFNAPADQQATVTAGQTTNVIGPYTATGARSDVDMLGSDQYGPRDINVKAGDTVVWTNRDTITNHTVAADSTNAVGGGPNSDTTQPNGVPPNGTFTFNVPANAVAGTVWYYHCRFHGAEGNGTSDGAGMSGSLTVVP